MKKNFLVSLFLIIFSLVASSVLAQEETERITLDLGEYGSFDIVVTRNEDGSVLTVDFDQVSISEGTEVTAITGYLRLDGFTAPDIALTNVEGVTSLFDTGGAVRLDWDSLGVNPNANLVIVSANPPKVFGDFGSGGSTTATLDPDGGGSTTGISVTASTIPEFSSVGIIAAIVVIAAVGAVIVLKKKKE